MICYDSPAGLDVLCEQSGRTLETCCYNRTGRSRGAVRTVRPVVRPAPARLLQRTDVRPTGLLQQVICD